jgi:hypothetical protein
MTDIDVIRTVSFCTDPAGPETAELKAANAPEWDLRTCQA